MLNVGVLTKMGDAAERNTIKGGRSVMRDFVHLQKLSAPTIVAFLTLLSGCVAQQADLKQTERQLQSRIKQSSEELAQRGAQQRAELEELKGDVLPKLQGEIQRAQHQAEQLQAKQEDLKQRSAVLEQQTKKLEQLASKLDTDNSNRYSQVRESLNAQDVKNKSDRDQLRSEVNNRLDEINRQMEALRKDVIDAVQKANASLARSVDVKMEEQRKALADNQTRAEQLSNKFSQFSQALAGFKESLTALGERVSQEEQANKALAAKLEADTKASTAHVNETTKTVTGHLNEVNKSVGAVAQKLATRFDEQFNELNANVSTVTQKLAARSDEQIGQVNTNLTSMAQSVNTRLNEQDQRIESLSRALEQFSQQVHLPEGGKNGQRHQTGKSALRSSAAPASSGLLRDTAPPHESDPTATAAVHDEAAPLSVALTPLPGEPDHAGKQAAVHPAERPDKAEYERLLGSFRDGDLEGARRGFAAFLSQYPNSDLAPNARYWLGESHYGKKDYKLAIDAYDRVELDYPQSEKVPAAILKKGYAYLALKDKKRASSAFKQVVTLYPKSPEAGKASDKLSQLKEPR